MKTLINKLKLEVLTQAKDAISRDLNEDVRAIDQEFDVMLNGKRIGFGFVKATQKILAYSFVGGFDDAPYGFESDLIVDSITVDLYSTTTDNKLDQLTNISEAVNELLEAEQCRVL